MITQILPSSSTRNTYSLDTSDN